MKRCELLVVGGGPAGMAAALQAATLGVQVVLVDEQPTLGGQYLTVQHHRPDPRSTRERRSAWMLDAIHQERITIRTGTLVWHASPNLRFGVSGPDGIETIEAASAIVATGAREFVLPFPGWTLPGVMTVGAAQLLAKRHGVSPGRKILLAGSGPMLWPAALHLSRTGAEVVAIVERVRPRRWLHQAPAVRGNMDRLLEGVGYIRRLVAKGIPLRFGWSVQQAHGDSRVGTVRLMRLDHAGNPMPESTEEIEVDTLCVSDGLVPNTELTRLVGCCHRYEGSLGGWIPQTNELMETSISGLYAIGEATGVMGAQAGVTAARIAAIAASHRLGKASTQHLTELRSAIASERAAQLRFGKMLNSLFSLQQGAAARIPNGTHVCRCEEVSIEEVRHAIHQGAHTLDALKKWTCVGQGPCQGRTCEPVLVQVLADELGVAPDKFSPFPVRPPLKPIGLGSLVEGVLA